MLLTLLLSLLTACSFAQAAGEISFQPATATTAPYWGDETIDSFNHKYFAELPSSGLVPGHFVQKYFADSDRDHCQDQKTTILILFRKRIKEAN